MNSDVFIVQAAPRYPLFPYYLDDQLVAAFRSMFLMWGKDPENPFKQWLVPGASVVIKPNWVQHDDPVENDLDALVTHTSLIKHLIDLAAVALRGTGSIVIGDAPLQSCDFPTLMTRTRIAEVVDEARRKYSGLNITIEDWRLTVFEQSAVLQRRQVDYERLLSRGY